MPAQNLARLAAVDPVATTLVPLPFKTLSLSLALLFLAGCATKPPMSAGPDPSDPGRGGHRALNTAPRSGVTRVRGRSLPQPGRSRTSL